MGREAEGTLCWQGVTGAGRMLVESGEVILRGEVRGRLPRDTIVAVRVDGDDLVLGTSHGPLVATVGAAVAQRLAQALTRPVPTLLQKLGLDGDATAGCLWPVTDGVLAAALTGRMAPVASATLLVAEVLNETSLSGLLDSLPDIAGRHLWCVNAKGPRAELPEARIRAALRGAGWIDSKTTAVSQTASAVRYGIRKG